MCLSDDSLTDHEHNTSTKYPRAFMDMTGTLVMSSWCQSSLPRSISLVLVTALASQGMCCQALEWWTHVSVGSSLLIRMVQ